MKTTINLKLNGRGRPSEAELDAIDSFRTWLQTVITAGQFGQNERLPRLPRSKTPMYCRSLAGLPDNALAKELSVPVLAVLDQIEHAAAIFERALPPERPGATMPAPSGSAPPAVCGRANAVSRQRLNPEQEAYEKVLWQLDYALALMLRRLSALAAARGKQSQCAELHSDVCSPRDILAFKA